uniref:Uncharacterized protein n=1 Tax=Spermophilus dauricus TaxID=99837 RepID=A0A8C9PQ43_SPEDA
LHMCHPCSCHSYQNLKYFDFPFSLLNCVLPLCKNNSHINTPSQFLFQVPSFVQVPILHFPYIFFRGLLTSFPFLQSCSPLFQPIFPPHSCATGVDFSIHIQY